MGWQFSHSSSFLLSAINDALFAILNPDPWQRHEDYHISTLRYYFAKTLDFLPQRLRDNAEIHGDFFLRLCVLVSLWFN